MEILGAFQHATGRICARLFLIDKLWNIDIIVMAPTLKDMFNTTSAYHLNGIFGNSGANSNGTVHPGGKFLEKR